MALSQALTLNASLGPAALTETVNVRPGAGEVITHTVEVATNFKQELMSTLPTTRDINAVILKAPAVHPSGPNGSYSIAGSMSFESLYLVNGVNVNENLRGQANNLYIEDAVQETMVATDGISAEYGRFSGGVVNVITKSGGNRFSGSFRDSLYNDDWRAKVNGNDDHPFTTDTKVDRVISQYQYVFGGPIQRDRLWFFTAGRFRKAPVGRNTVAPLNIPYTFEDESQRYEGKVTYSANPNHRFDGTYTKVLQTEANGTFSTATSMDLRSLYTRELPQNLFTVGYSGVLSPSFFLEGRYSVRHFSFIGSGATSTDLIDGTLLIDSARGNLRYWSPTFCGVCNTEKRDNEEVFVKGTYVLSTGGGIPHGPLRLRHLQRQALCQQPSVGERLPHPRDDHHHPRRRHLSALAAGFDHHSVQPDHDRERGHQLQDQRALHQRQLALDRPCHGQPGPAVGQEPGQGQRRQYGRRRQRLQPARRRRLGSHREGAVGDHRQLREIRQPGSTTRSPIRPPRPATRRHPVTYQGPAINPDANAATLVTSDVALQQLFAWFDANGGTGMTPASSSVPGVSVQIPNSLTSPNVRAYAAGVSRQLTAVRSFAPITRSVTIATSIRRGSIAPTGIVVDQSGNRADLAVIENTNDLKRRYSGVTVSGRYRINSRSDAGGSYTLSRLWGNFDGENTASGPLTTDLFQYPDTGRRRGLRLKVTSRPISVTGRASGSTMACPRSRG